jgi:predicted transposase/invertase (TIGR01784 family)
VNGFNQVAKSPLEEWIYYLNTGEIPSTATAPGLEEARERLKLDSMSKNELAAYYRHLDNIVILRDNINTEREEGRAEGIEEGLNKGLLKGREEEKRENARNLKNLGIAIEIISQATGLSQEEIESL